MSTSQFSATTNALYRAAIVAIAPAVALLGSGYHPWIGTPRDPGFFARIATAVASDTTRWWVSHLLVAVASGLLVLAFIAIRSHLREAGDERWSILALPFVVMGSTLYVMLPAMEFAPVAATEVGVDAAAIQEALMPWFMPILLTSAAFFAVGVFGFGIAIARSRVLSPVPTRIVVAALFVMAAARFFPVGAAQLYVGPAAGIVALWPLARAMWKQPVARAAEGAEAGRAVAA